MFPTPSASTAAWIVSARPSMVYGWAWPIGRTGAITAPSLCGGQTLRLAVGAAGHDNTSPMVLAPLIRPFLAGYPAILLEIAVEDTQNDMVSVSSTPEFVSGTELSTT